MCDSSGSSLKRFYVARCVKFVSVENAVIRFRLLFIITRACFLIFAAVYIAPTLMALIAILAQ
jgi:hypothetical protein